jgi:two-component system LytT family sensor kinase
MKRIVLHSIFWLAYIFQDVLLLFFLNTTRFNLSPSVNLLFAIQNCLVILLPKLFFTYFILYFTLRSIREAGIQRKKVLYSLLALLIALLLYRSLVIYFVDPVINGRPNELSFFHPLGFLVALMDIGFVSGAAIGIKLVRLQQRARENEKNLVKEKLETELKYLRYQTNPHFLFNTLNNIYSLARKRSDQTAEVVLKLSKLLRFMLYEAVKPSITIGAELKMLDDYIELESIRYDGRLTINFLREIDNDLEPVLPLLLLPFVENAFKHGASESISDAYIHIDMKLENSMLYFTIENTKENMQATGIAETIGLKNVSRQLELRYKDYNLVVQNDPAVFKVFLTINLKSNAEV